MSIYQAIPLWNEFGSTNGIDTTRESKLLAFLLVVRLLSDKLAKR